MNKTFVGLGAASLGVLAFALSFAVSNLGHTVHIECVPDGGDCVAYGSPDPDQCAALLRRAGDNIGPILNDGTEPTNDTGGYRADDGDELVGRILVSLHQEGAILGWHTERLAEAPLGDGCLVSIFLTRDQANQWVSATSNTEGELVALPADVDAIFAGEPTATRPSVVLAGQDNAWERTEHFLISTR